MRAAAVWRLHGRATAGIMRRSFASAPLSLVKELRELSGAPITDCKKALEAEGVGGDIKKAFEWLRKKGAATIAKSNRSANEGLIGVALQGSNGVIVEVNSETDFVARNADFQGFVSGLAQSTLAMGVPSSEAAAVVEMDVPSLLQANGSRGQVPIGTELADLVAKIRENIVIRRAARLSVPDGIIASYVHNATGPSIGTAAALVGLRVEASILSAPKARATVEQFGKRLAMHVVAARPRFLSVDSIPPSVVEHERAIIREQSASSGKPEAIVAKMTEGRLNKFLSELTLLEQAHMIEEGNPRVRDLLKPLSQELKGKVEVVGFLRYKCGEDIDTGSSK